MLKSQQKVDLLRQKINCGLKEENIASIGDQIFTDVIGANRCNMKSILVKPVDSRDFWYTKWKRPVEALIIKKYLKKLERKASWSNVYK